MKNETGAISTAMPTNSFPISYVGFGIYSFFFSEKEKENKITRLQILIMYAGTHCGMESVCYFSFEWFGARHSKSLFLFAFLAKVLMPSLLSNYLYRDLSGMY